MFSVDGGQRGLIFDKMRGGYQDTLAYEGTSFVIPYFQQPIIIDIRTTPREIKVRRRPRSENTRPLPPLFPPPARPPPPHLSPPPPPPLSR